MFPSLDDGLNSLDTTKYVSRNKLKRRKENTKDIRSKEVIGIGRYAELLKRLVPD